MILFYLFLQKPMTEYDQPSAEYLAHAAVDDYLSVGSEPGFGELETEALDEWISLTEEHIGKLKPSETINVAWMRVERSWSRVVEAGPLGQQPTPDIAKLAIQDLRIAERLFRQSRVKASYPQRAHIDTAITSLPMVELILSHPTNSVQAKQMAAYLATQFDSNLLLFDDFTKRGHITDIPSLDTSLGLRLLTTNFLNTSYIPLVAAPRHIHASVPAQRWHAALYDRSTTKTHKIRIAPHGPPDMILLPPSLFGHAEIPTSHSRGMLEAMVMSDVWAHEQRKRRRTGKELTITPKVASYREKITVLDERVGAHLDQELARLDAETPEYSPPADCVQWYETLSPFADPCHESYGGALETAASQLEMLRLTDENTPDSDYLLGWMHLEAGLSLRAGDTAHQSSLIGSLERAEDMFKITRDAIPEDLRRSSRFFELAIAEAAAPMYRALIAHENVSEHLDIYCAQLAILAPQIRDALKQTGDTSSNEAEALTHLLHQISAYLLVSHTPDKTFIALPGSPRQRGGNGGNPRGWDFSMWSFDSEDTYVLGQFYGRLETEEDPYSVDNGVVTIAKKRLGPSDFRVLDAVVSIINPSAGRTKPDYKVVNKARSHLLQMAESD
ncbi:MAG TPA: hypothetical protein VM581_05355 [Magnetospirillaceae bacterium]|nr:hypothetical protein [Magnetospirillaceae bacterium]